MHSAEQTPKKNHEFESFLLNETGKQKALQIQEAFDGCLNSLESVCPGGRYWALAKTKLEEACFFAKKCMAIEYDNQQR